ncbi:MAG: glycoside hydrolase family 3 C-terminal domain-containing protein, partial [Oscillospiraceae bacterium]|nr:glycoside hydrolase family 3 C-terminal domain-containing protein [Oscillospiraceae bacterium]
MIELNMSDVISVLNTCQPYLISFGIVAVLAVIVMIACGKLSKPLKGLIRGEAVVAIVLALVVVANLICTGPMSTLLSLAPGGSGTIPDEITAQTNEDTRQIAREGIVLLENSGLLPLEKGKSVNVFGWASVNPIYGGSGAGALNDLYPKTSLIEGLENAGFSVNSDLTKFYTDFGGSRAGYGSDWSLPEPTAESYGSLMDSAKSFSDTAIMVVARWGGEGSDVPADMTTVSYTNNSDAYADFQPGQSYLELSQTEKNVLDQICASFDNVILVFDGLTSFELGFVEDYPQIKSVLLCNGPGQTGFDALGQVLCGEVNPSGKTVDTYLYDLTAAPWWNNFGSFIYDNMSEFAVDASDPYMGGTVPTFVNLTESIYVGYKYYETAAAEGVINYDSVVQYPFGYGLSYTSFKQELVNISDKDGVIRFDVTVTNTGNIAGKEVVEVYVNPPYTNGGIEKASANLLVFDKTDLLEPGASQTLSFTVNEEDLASYDDKVNRCYVLDAGNYIISINSDSHNVIDSFTHSVASTVVYSENSARSTDLVAAVNQFDDAAGNVTYLSRKDGFANLAQATVAPASLSMADEQKAGFTWTYNYTMEQNPNAQVPTLGAKNGAVLADLRGKSYDDSAWDTLLDQLTMDEMQDMIAHAGFQTASAPSVGKGSTIV